MSLEVYESAKSGGDLKRKAGKGQTDSRIYVVRADAGESGSQAVSAALGVAPLLIATPETDLIAVGGSPRILTPLDSNGIGAYEVTIDYAEEDEEKSQERPEPGTWHYSIDSGNASIRVFKSLEQVSYGGPDGVSTGPDYGLSIGWDGKQAKGVDDSVPAPEFSITAYYKPTAVTTQMFATMSSKTNRTNSAAWLGFPAGTLLFQNFSGNGDIPTVAGQRVKPVPITFKFAYSENLTNIDLGDGIIVPSKKGWEYLDVQYQTEDDGTHVVPKVKRWAVHRLKEELDFAASFGFGG